MEKYILKSAFIFMFLKFIKYENIDFKKKTITIKMLTFRIFKLFKFRSFKKLLK